MTKKWNKKEIYFSIDIETDGPIPGEYSMLSCGVVPVYMGQIIDKGIEVNFNLLEGAKQRPETMEFWAKNQEAYNATRVNTVDPYDGMTQIDFYIKSWAAEKAARPVIVGYPVFFDYMFVYWYFLKFYGAPPTSFSALDLKTAAMCKLHCGYTEATKRNFPRNWHGKRSHNHTALDDAYGQAELFINMANDGRNHLQV